jgi:hypothetical protein
MNAITIRRWHSYVGLFIAPSVLFFALTGGVQLFSLHEAHGHYEPPAIIEKLSSVHKDQVFALGDHHDQPAPDNETGNTDASAAPRAGAEEDGDKRGLSTILLKSFFLVVALGLTLSAALGLWMGLTQTRNKQTAWILVAAGTFIPVVLLLF